jgi:hypothetical protein
MRARKKTPQEGQMMATVTMNANRTAMTRLFFIVTAIVLEAVMNDICRAVGLGSLPSAEAESHLAIGVIIEDGKWRTWLDVLFSTLQVVAGKQSKLLKVVVLPSNSTLKNCSVILDVCQVVVECFVKQLHCRFEVFGTFLHTRLGEEASLIRTTNLKNNPFERRDFRIHITVFHIAANNGHDAFSILDGVLDFPTTHF